VDLSSDDNATALSDSNDDFSSILLPPGFQPAAMPPHGNMLVPLDPAGQQIVFYPDDGSSGPYCLSLDNYNIDTDDDSPNHTWLLPDLSKT